jgi:type VI protein secretion system component Hcp
MSYRYFLKIDGVLGGSKEPLHAGAIELESISFGHGRTPSVGAGNGGGGESRVSEIVCFKRADVLSGLLFHASSSGQLFKEATLTIEQTTFIGIRVTKAVIKLTSVLVESVSARPGFDEIVLNFGSMRFQQGGVQAVDDAGRRSQWDLYSGRGG